MYQYSLIFDLKGASLLSLLQLIMGKKMVAEDKKLIEGMGIDFETEPANDEADVFTVSFKKSADPDNEKPFSERTRLRDDNESYTPLKFQDEKLITNPAEAANTKKLVMAFYAVNDFGHGYSHITGLISTDPQGNLILEHSNAGSSRVLQDPISDFIRFEYAEKSIRKNPEVISMTDERSLAV
jgi:hypothetical protein